MTELKLFLPPIGRAVAELKLASSDRIQTISVTARSICGVIKAVSVTNRGGCDGIGATSVTERASSDGIKSNSATARASGAIIVDISVLELKRAPACTRQGLRPHLFARRCLERSESTRISTRYDAKVAARKLDSCLDALHQGDAVRVFSRSADKWVHAEIVKLCDGNFVRVEYEVNDYWCGNS